jgi:hypothetical protein
MASDISHFLQKHDLKNVNLLGHSMWVRGPSTARLIRLPNCGYNAESAGEGKP